jgi:predicted Zn-dependent protease
MALTIRQTKTPAQAVANWTAGVQRSGTKWSTGVLSPKRDPFQAAAASVSNWVAAVSSQAAQNNFVKGLQNVDVTAFTATVTGSGQQKYVASATTKTSKETAFMNAFLPQLDSITNNLNRTNPRGPRGSAQNITRLTSYLQQVSALRGTL